MSMSRYAFAVILLLCIGCLERVTGEAKSLPEAFTVGVEEGGVVVEHGEFVHDPNADPSSALFGDYEGDTVTVTGIVTSEVDAAVDVDVQTSDPSSAGGMTQLGKVLMEAPGEITFAAPVDFGDLTLQAFQDATGDGPSDDDPFAAVSLTIGDTDVTGVEIDLVVGARSEAQLAAGSGTDIFGEHDGEWTVLKGTVTSPLEGGVDFDVRVPASDGASGDAYLGKVQFPSAGEYSWKVPRDHGILLLQVFQDTNTNGPDASDPFAQVEVEIGDVEIVELDIELSTGGYSAPSSEGAAPPVAAGAGGIAQALFDDLGDSPVTVSGTLSAPGIEGAVIDVDVFAVDPQGHGGRRYLGKLKSEPGAFSLEVPRNFGAIELEAIIDEASDGPTPGDPRGVYTGNPLQIGTVDLAGVDIVVLTSG